jgi:hypothetical protein
MVKRTANDLTLYVMISVFLRLLKKILRNYVLTTYIIDKFNSVFKSRICICIQYNDLDKESRYKVWTKYYYQLKIFRNYQ